MTGKIDAFRRVNRCGNCTWFVRGADDPDRTGRCLYAPPADVDERPSDDDPLAGRPRTHETLTCARWSEAHESSDWEPDRG